MNQHSKRNLRVSYRAERRKDSPQGLAFFPKCTLAGKWLRAAGFEIGDQVVIEVEQGKVTIKKA
jgi:hypothetical protein